MRIRHRKMFATYNIKVDILRLRAQRCGIKVEQLPSAASSVTGLSSQIPQFESMSIVTRFALVQLQNASIVSRRHVHGHAEAQRSTLVGQ